MPLIKDVIAAIEDFAPRSLQESYDNSGLQIGETNVECSAILTCLDVTEAILDEAVDKGCNLIISHHPLLFRPLRTLSGKTLAERIAIKAIRAGVTIYAAHTNLDNAWGGVSHQIAKKLGVTKPTPLVPQKESMFKIVFFTPSTHALDVRKAAFQAGAGKLGNYDSCGFTVEGRGTFRALEGSKPFVGDINVLHNETEVRQEFLVSKHQLSHVLNEILNAHPYEQPAYDIIKLENENPLQGTGVIGDIKPTTKADFIALVKKVMNVATIRCSDNDSNIISKVAICSGAGASFIRDAIASGADAYITGDVGYHDFATYGNEILLTDIGHFESELCTKEIFHDILANKFSELTLHASTAEKNPIKYL